MSALLADRSSYFYPFDPEIYSQGSFLIGTTARPIGMDKAASIEPVPAMQSVDEEAPVWTSLTMLSQSCFTSARRVCV